MLLEVETGKGRSDIVVARKDRKMGFIVEVKQVKKTMKRQNLDQVLGNHALEDYDAQYRFVMRLIEEGKIRPVKSSARNGKKPALYTEYHIIEEAEDDSGQEYELIYQTDPRISVYYYLEHPDVYRREREAVRRLDDFLKNRSERLKISVSFNERCFEIWSQEESKMPQAYR